jgi:hypothetical protein
MKVVPKNLNGPDSITMTMKKNLTYSGHKKELVLQILLFLCKNESLQFFSMLFAEKKIG